MDAILKLEHIQKNYGNEGNLTKAKLLERISDIRSSEMPHQKSLLRFLSN